MSGLFDSSNKVAGKTAGATKSKTPEHEVPGVLRFGGFSVLEKTVKALKETAQTALKELTVEMHADFGMRAGKAPESFRGVEPGNQKAASASIQMRARPKTSPLTTDELVVLIDHKFPVEDNVITVDTFVINPAHVNDENVLKVMQKLLGPAQKKGELPEDLFQKQDGVSKKVLPENALDHLFKTYPLVPGDAVQTEKNRATVMTLLPIVGVAATGSVKLAEDSLTDTLVVLADELDNDDLAKAIKKLQALAEKRDADKRTNEQASMREPKSRKAK